MLISKILRNGLTINKYEKKVVECTFMDFF